MATRSIKRSEKKTREALHAAIELCITVIYVENIFPRAETERAHRKSPAKALNPFPRILVNEDSNSSSLMLNGKFARVGEPSPMFINLLDSMMLHDVFLFVLFALYFAKKAHKDTSAGLYTPLPKECSRKFASSKVFSSQTCTTMENSRSPEQSAHRALFAFSISIRKRLPRRRDKHWVARQKNTQNSCVYAEFVFSSERTFNFCRNSCTCQPLGACLHTTLMPSDKIRVIDMHDGKDGGSLKPEVFGACTVAKA